MDINAGVYHDLSSYVYGKYRSSPRSSYMLAEALPLRAEAADTAVGERLELSVGLSGTLLLKCGKPSFELKRPYDRYVSGLASGGDRLFGKVFYISKDGSGLIFVEIFVDERKKPCDN